MENDKAWEIRSDEWIKSMNESKLLKEQRLHKRLIEGELKEDVLRNVEHCTYDPYAIKKSG